MGLVGASIITDIMVFRATTHPSLRGANAASEGLIKSRSSVIVREQEGSRTQPFQEASIEIFFMISTASINLGVGIYVRSVPVACGPVVSR